MKNPFAAEEIGWISPSINRLRIKELPGVDLPNGVKGKLAFDLLSSDAVASMIRPFTDELGLTSASANLITGLDRCFSAGSSDARSRARSLAKEYGRNLAYVLLALKRGDAANRDARAEWGEDHWQFWSEINAVWVGGGLSAGPFGQIAVDEAAALVTSAGFPEMTVQLTPYHKNLSVIGASRFAPEGTEAALLADFGHSHVKQACAIYEDGALVEIHHFTDLDAPCQEFIDGDGSLNAIIRQAEWMQAAIAISWHEAIELGLDPEPTVIASLACYMHHGQPYSTEMGCYGRLQLLDDNLQEFFANQLSIQLEMPVQVKLIQDGTAAAAVYAGTENCAVLTLGTAVGVGFPVAEEGLMRLAPQLGAVN